MSGVIDQARWGICGFVSVLNALHEDGRLEEFVPGLSVAEIQARLGAEVITFLRMVRQEDPDLADDIVTFSLRLGGGPEDTIEAICRKIRDYVLAADGTVKQAIGWDGVVVAMPPRGILEFLHRAGLSAKLDDRTYNLSTARLASLRNCVVGVGYMKPPEDYGYLKHWVYVNRNSEVLNWGTRRNLKTEGLPSHERFPFDFITQVIYLE